MMDVAVEHVGDDLLCPMRMQSKLRSPRRESFGETLEWKERTLLNGRHEQVRCRFVEVLVARPDDHLAVWAFSRHRRYPFRPRARAAGYLSSFIGRTRVGRSDRSLAQGGPWIRHRDAGTVARPATLCAILFRRNADAGQGSPWKSTI